MNPRLIDDVDHWRNRAEEARTVAEAMRYDERARQTMLRIASDYDKMARYAEARQQRKSTP